MDFSTLPDQIVLALLIWGEARGEPLEGQVAVASVVRNRKKAEQSWRDVCLAPEQFSCFNEDSPEAAAMQRAATMLLTKVPPPILAQALWIADGVIAGAVIDVTHGARNYLTTQLLTTKPPKWAKDRPVLARIGNHTFLNA